MEELLHYVWKHKIFPLKELFTTGGQPVEVIDSGLANPNAGPDFFNAKIRIDHTMWVGNVEIHQRSSDWNKHGHFSDKAYDSVILHVVGDNDSDVFRTTGEQVPQLKLPCPDYIKERYQELKEMEIKPPCFPVIPKLSQFTVHSWLSALQAERYDSKTTIISDRLRKTGNNWEDSFFITLARNFGFGLNGDAFETWANLLSFRSIDKHRDNLSQVEAIFFGQAGLLTEDISDSYYQMLQNEYKYLKHKFNLEQMDSSLWRFLRLRPGNFPHVRIAQLAYSYHTKQGLFSQIMSADSISQIKSLLATKTSMYWNNHFTFRNQSPEREKILGEKSIELIVINTVIPFLDTYGRKKINNELRNRASRFLDELNAENNYIIRSWANVGLEAKTAADSQALLQLQKEYCDRKKCLYCRFGYEYLRIK